MRAPSDILRSLLDAPSRRIAGVMSGTSLDAIDVAIVDVTGSGERVKLTHVAYHETPLAADVREMIRRNSEAETSSVREITLLHALLSDLYANAIEATATKHAVPLSSIDLVGLHGQTIHHMPKPESIHGYDVASTMQIGSGARLAARLGIPVVSDFRSADVALGGQGAPLVPYADFCFFKSDKYDRILINIGGIANLTFLPRGAGVERTVAFDCGPGNMLIDGAMRRLFDAPFDDGGRTAARGSVVQPLLDELLREPFYDQPPPRSTGRELFGERYLAHIIHTARETHRCADEDVVATLSQLTVECIARSVALCTRADEDCEIIISGGGSHNEWLLRAIASRLSPARVETSDRFGVPADAKEALCFAFFANEWLHGRPIALPSVTGAARTTLSGVLALG